MANSQEIRTIVGTIGTVISSLISLAQMPTFINIYKKKSVEDYQPHRHMAMVVKCSLWVLYGLPLVQNDSILVTATNGIGLLIEAIYLLVFCLYCGDELQRKLIYECLVLEFVFVAYFYGTTLWALGSLPSSRHIFIGVVCNVFTIVMYASLVKSFRYRPAALSLVSFINAGIWIAYSLIYKIDIYVLISNGLGALSCAYQLIENVFPQSTTPAVSAANV